MKNLDLLCDNKPLKIWLKELQQKQIQKDKNKIVEGGIDTSGLEGLVDPTPLADFKIPEDNFFSDYDSDKLLEIMNEQMAVVKLLKKHNKSKHLANRY